MTSPTPPPAPNPLVVDVDEVARQLKLDLPLDTDTAETLRQAILNAQADVEAYLGRPIVPQARTATGLWPPFGVPWAAAIDDDDLLSVVSVTPEAYIDTGQPSGTFTVSYLAGLDARNDPSLRPILRFVTASAKNDPAVLDIWTQLVRPRGPITSVSVDGQSASFSAPWHGQGTIPGSGAPGALPTLADLYPWKKGTVYQRRDARFDWAFDDRVARGPWGP